MKDRASYGLRTNLKKYKCSSFELFSLVEDAALRESLEKYSEEKEARRYPYKYTFGKNRYVIELYIYKSSQRIIMFRLVLRGIDMIEYDRIQNSQDFHEIFDVICSSKEPLAFLCESSFESKRTSKDNIITFPIDLNIFDYNQLRGLILAKVDDDNIKATNEVKISDDNKNIISTVKFQYYDTCSPEIVTKILLEAKNLALI